MTEELGLPEDDPTIAEGDKAVLRAALTGEGLIFLNAESLRERVEAAGERWKEADADFANMTQEQADFARHLRVDENYSWRAVAEACYLEWGGDWYPPSNQIWGMAICEHAAAMFGEHYMDETWN